MFGRITTESGKSNSLWSLKRDLKRPEVPDVFWLEHSRMSSGGPPPDALEPAGPFHWSRRNFAPAARSSFAWLRGLSPPHRCGCRPTVTGYGIPNQAFFPSAIFSFGQSPSCVIPSKCRTFSG